MNPFIEQQQKAIEKLERNLVESRLENRLIWDKLLTTVLGVLGFSLTLFSTDFLSSQITHSFAKYGLLISWLTYGGALFVGFWLLKKETVFQTNESIRNNFFAMDMAEIMSGNTARLSDDMKNRFIALLILQLRSRNLNENHWTKGALETFDKHKKELQSYRLAKDPETFYSAQDRKEIYHIETYFYWLTVAGTLFLIATITSILI